MPVPAGTVCRFGRTPVTRPRLLESHAGCRVPNGLHTMEVLVFWPVFELRSNSFHLDGAHHPNPIEKESGGQCCLVYICSKQENMLRFDSQKIRQLFKTARAPLPPHFFLGTRKTSECPQKRNLRQFRA